MDVRVGGKIKKHASKMGTNGGAEAQQEVNKEK